MPETRTPSAQDAPPRRLSRSSILLALGLGICLLSPSVRGLRELASSARRDQPAPRAAPNLLLITVDTLRPDALGWVAGKNPTPAIDRLALEGVRFPAAISPVPMTLPAHTSILSGLLPRRHGVRDNGQQVPLAVETLAERLRTRGYSTAAFVSGFPLESIFGLDQGFTTYDDRLPEGKEGWLERRAFDTATAAEKWIATAKSPWFVWVHFYDPHDPYEPPRSFWRPGPRGEYDGEVAYVDAWIARLRASIPEASAANLLTILTADHGEALGEHREKTHGYFLYDSTIQVPLIFHFPGRLRPLANPAAARLIDVAPTALDLLGLPPLAGVDGLSLRPWLSGSRAALPPAYVETRLPWIYFGWSPLTALRNAEWKLIEAPRPELYDLTKDAQEANNRVDAERPRARQLIADLRAIEKRPAISVSSQGGGVDDPEVIARLRALGYVGAGGGPSEAPRGLADPKDRIEQRDTLQEAERLLRDGRTAAAITKFDEVLALDPKNRFATLRSGTALLNTGKIEEAAARLARAVAIDPERAEARFALGDALLRLGRAKESIPHWLELVRLQPRRADGWSNLGLAFLAAGERTRAREALTEAVRLDPENPRRRRDLAPLLPAR